MDMQKPEQARYARSITQRWVTGLFGGFLVVVAVVIVVSFGAGNRALAWIAVLVLAGLGIDAVIGALRNRRSVLERIGPLP
jgi:uncharacterized membrane protein YdcZ (DUF606 family)